MLLDTVYVSDSQLKELREAGFESVADSIVRLRTGHRKSISELARAECNLQKAYRELDDLQCVLDCTLQQRFARFNEEECWIFQDDGEDYLESLVCPVVTTKDKLIELIEYRKKYQNSQQDCSNESK